MTVSPHENSLSKEKTKDTKHFLKNMLKNMNCGSVSDLNRERLAASKLKQRLTKEKPLFERRISQKRSSKKKEESKTEARVNAFMTSDGRSITKSGECKAGGVVGGRSNSIDASKKKMKEKRKKSTIEFQGSFMNLTSGTSVLRNMSGQFVSNMKALKAQGSEKAGGFRMATTGK